MSQYEVLWRLSFFGRRPDAERVAAKLLAGIESGTIAFTPAPDATDSREQSAAPRRHGNDYFVWSLIVTAAWAIVVGAALAFALTTPARLPGPPRGATIPDIMTIFNTFG